MSEFENTPGEKLQPMPQVFYCAGLVRDFMTNLKQANKGEDFDEMEKWAVAVNDAKKDLHDAIDALPEGERGTLVAMYETLRHWAYR